ncbi:endonuclease domain-containing 1 -like protein [Labeo rohita]|uniref:Endonuclease domain-containing 1-like protein n=1 Tax=Labeo rohita TaxID=84645 RepID=A0A498M1M3_LABRO|nr:endonuclease domain-containing 1 -like protein [Labeo rohita]
MSKGAQSNFFTLQNVISSDDASSSAKKPKITELSANLGFDSPSSFFTSVETLKKESRSACLLIAPKKRSLSEQRDFSKREVSEGSGSLECRLVPEKSVDKTAADGSECTRSEDNGYRCTCTTPEGQSKPCCSTPCLYQDQLKGYRCYSGWKQIECSPQYSLIAIEGKRCRDDHPCATYGEDYYWCYTDESWEYCSPPLWGSRTKDGKFCRSDYACAKYNKDDLWCYTDNVGSWNYCCTSDDCFSAVQYKTCKPDHPCGYHGKGYLWCYTTDGSWDYCCKQCV